jgi:hypothetical protein
MDANHAWVVSTTPWIVRTHVGVGFPAEKAKLAQPLHGTMLGLLDEHSHGKAVDEAARCLVLDFRSSESAAPYPAKDSGRRLTKPGRHLDNSGPLRALGKAHLVREGIVFGCLFEEFYELQFSILQFSPFAPRNQLC